MAEIYLTEDEKELIKFLIKKEIGLFRKEKSSIKDNMSPSFMKSEELNEDFLEKLIEKMK